MNICRVCVGDISAEIKTEADRNDVTECPCDDNPSTGGMFAVSNVLNTRTSMCCYFSTKKNIFYFLFQLSKYHS